MATYEYDGLMTVKNAAGDKFLLYPITKAANITSGILDAARIPNLDAGKITTGTLPVTRGGTGTAAFSAGAALVGAGTGAVTSRTIRNNTSVNIVVPAEESLITCSTLRYAINRTTSVAAADTGYTTLMARGMSLHSTETTPAVNGAIAWTYE